MLLAPKHQSTWETFAYPALLSHPLAYVFKRELLYVPFFGWAMARMDMIHIDRGRRTIEARARVLLDRVEELYAKHTTRLTTPELNRALSELKEARPGPAGERGRRDGGGHVDRVHVLPAGPPGGRQEFREEVRVPDREVARVVLSEDAERARDARGDDRHGRGEFRDPRARPLLRGLPVHQIDILRGRDAGLIQKNTGTSQFAGLE